MRKPYTSPLRGLAAVLVLFALLPAVPAPVHAQRRPPAAPQACATAPEGLVSWWPADGSAEDIAGGNHGSLVNGATYAAGRVGRAFALDGIDDSVDVPDSPTLSPPSITFEAWVRPDGNPGGVTMHLLSKDDNVFQRQYLFETGSPPLFFFRSVIWTAGGALDVEGVTPIQFGTWYHVAVTYDGSLFNVYVNGALDGTDVGAGPLVVTNQPVQMGTAGPCCRFNGLIDEASIYNRALTAEEVRSIYAAGSAGKCKPPMFVAAVDPFSEAAGGSFRVGANVAIQDTDSAPVSGARVSLQVTFPDGDTITVLPETDAGGLASFSFLTSQLGTYTFTVVNVIKPGTPYDPSLNLESMDTITVPAVIHVASIDPFYEPSGGQYLIGTGVTIHDQDGTPVAGAQVRLRVTLPGGGELGLLSTTDSSGTATVSFLSGQTGTYTFTVASVRKSGTTYDPAANLETSDSVTIP